MVCGKYGSASTGLTGDFVKGRRRGEVDGIDVIEFDLAYANTDGFLKRTATFLRYAVGAVGVALRERYDLAIASTTPLTVGIPAITARWLRRKPYVFEVRDLWPELPKAMGVIKNPLALLAMSALEWLSYRNAVRCIGLAPGIVSGIAARGVPESRIRLVPNGCDLHIFGETISPWRPASVRDDQLLAIFSGTHGQANGLDAVLDAAALLKARKRDDIVILLIGSGKLKPDLITRSREEGLENILFHAPVDKKKLAELMASSDIGLQILANVPAFYYGTSPNKFFDYLAAGLPVLTNYPGWVAEMIARERCGVAVKPDDAEALADALEKLADDRTALPSMGAAATSLAQREFDRIQLADRWVAWVTEGKRRQ